MSISSFCDLLALLRIDQLDQNRAAVNLPPLIGAEDRQHVADAGKRLEFGFQLLHNTSEDPSSEEPGGSFTVTSNSL